MTSVDRLSDIARHWRPGLSVDLVAAAVDCLVAGADSPSLRELAGASPRASYDELAPLVADALDELGWSPPPPGRTVGVDGLQGFLALVLDDASELGLDLQLDVVAGTDEPGSAYLTFDGGWWMLVNGLDDHTPAEELEIIADRVHEWLVEELPSQHRSTSWPGCPDHPGTHPLWPQRHDDVVAWTCPTTSDPHARIGELRGLTQRSS